MTRSRENQHDRNGSCPRAQRTPFDHSTCPACGISALRPGPTLDTEREPLKTQQMDQLIRAMNLFATHQHGFVLIIVRGLEFSTVNGQARLITTFGSEAPRITGCSGKPAQNTGNYGDG